MTAPFSFKVNLYISSTMAVDKQPRQSQRHGVRHLIIFARRGQDKLKSVSTFNFFKCCLLMKPFIYKYVSFTCGNSDSNYRRKF